MRTELLRDLNKFIGQASKATYAGGGGKVETPQRKGFNELEFTDGDWYYLDSYTGFLRSWGQEVVMHNKQLFWTCLYGGGMTDEHMDIGFATETFNFLKKVLSAGEKETEFQPRGPKKFVDGEWEYRCKVKGTIERFSGHETIQHLGELVFTHDFMGGLVVGEDE